MKLAHYNTKARDVAGVAEWERQAVVHTRGANLVTVSAHDKSGAGFYFMVFDAGTDAASAENLIAIAWVNPNQAHTFDFRFIERKLKHGIYLVASTTAGTKNLIATNDAFFTCAYKV